MHLTGKEYQMLELLCLRKGTTLTKEMFLNHLYGGMDEPELKIIDVFICKLRKKLAQATGGDNYIETVWGRGYVLRDPEPLAIRSADRRERLRPSGLPQIWRGGSQGTGPRLGRLLSLRESSIRGEGPMPEEQTDSAAISVDD